ncbi:MAG: WYL domain-containing protein [Deferribacteres bacterium]|nr:WYL domain-containing protein [Deferribacteres bacterium]
MENKPIKEVPIVVIDTETTGLAHDSYIIEVGAVKLLGDRLVDTFSTLIRPPIPIPKKVTKIHGINDYMVKDAPTFPFVVDKFLSFIKDSILVAHNAPFDMKVLTVNIKRAGKRLPTNPVLDTCRISRSLFPELRSHSLKYLALYWGSPFKELHRALSDAKHTAYVFLSILKKCGFTMDDSVSKLFELLGPPIYFKDFEHIYTHPDTEETDTVQFIIRCIEAGKKIELLYHCENNLDLKRRVIPLNLFTKQEMLYLKAYCLMDGREKSFRIDRIKRVRVWENEVETGTGHTCYFR